jgi:23S rRNA A2030 N6-methylase RlmJ
MSLIINNRLKDDQREYLESHGYYGTYDLSEEEAQEIIDALYVQERQRIQLEGQPELLWIEGGELNWIIKEEF